MQTSRLALRRYDEPMARPPGIVILAAAIVAAGAAVAIAIAARPAPPEPPPVRNLRLSPPLRDAQTGEWLRLQSGRDVQVYRIVDSGDLDVTVETTVYRDDRPLEAPQQQKWSRNAFGVPPSLGVIRAIDPETLSVGGRNYDCWRIAVFGRDQQFYFWICDEVPVHGLVKVAHIMKDGQPDEANAVTIVDSGSQ